MMFEYFINNGLDIEKPIFNIEFQMHRTHLKSFGIDILKDLLANANSLYKKAMDDIRVIDISTVSEQELKNNNKNRAKTLPMKKKSFKLKKQKKHIQMLSILIKTVMK